MKAKPILLLTALAALALGASAQTKPLLKNTTVKEYSLKAKSKTQMLDHVTVYDELGRKIEETEYAVYGQKNRVVYEYEGDSRLCTREIVYNDKNSPVRIKKIEYNPDCTKHRELVYDPDGILKSSKTYTYETRKK